MSENHSRHYHSTIIISACIMAVAIVGGALLFSSYDRAAGKNKKPREAVVRRQFAEQLQAQLKGRPVLAGLERTVRHVEITDLRYSSREDSILVEFSLVTAPATNLTGSCILMDDGYRRYVGQWGREQNNAHFLIK